MLNWFQSLMPKEDKFFEHADAHAALLVLGGQALREMLEDGANIAACAERIGKHETDADEITREVMLGVRRSFITPFERGDMQSLISSMDDAIDQMRKTTKLVVLYEIINFEPHMRQMADIIVRAAKLSVEMIKALRNMSQEAYRLGQLVEEIVKIEDEADGLHDQGLKELFRRSRADPMAFIVGTEVYGSLEKVMDRFEDVANNINSIVVAQL